MELNQYKYYNEDIYSTTLKNGLRVFLVKTKANFVCMKYGVNFGGGKLGTLDGFPIPLGSAHFLEHRIFDYKNQDVLDLFENLGAKANAYTSRIHTIYEVTTNNNIEECLNLLLDFTQQIEFSDEAFENEKDIIVNEINGNMDRQTYHISKTLSKNTYKSIENYCDIGGDEESVRNTTKEDLYRIHSYFYNPDNACLVVVGNIDINKILKIIKTNQKQKTFKPKPKYKPLRGKESENVVKEVDSMKASLGSNMVNVRFKLPRLDISFEEYNKLSYVAGFYDELMFARTSKLFKQVKKIMMGNSLFSSVDYSYTTNDVFVSCYTSDIDKMSESIFNAIDNYKRYLDKDMFEARKHAKLAQIYTLTDDNDELADTIISNVFDNNDFFNDIDILLKVEYSDVLKFGEYMKNSPRTLLKVFNKEI